MITDSLESFLIERDQRLTRSLLWRLQRSFYEQQGIAAWSHATVPHYITNNPVIAEAYARLVMAYLRDCHSAGRLQADQPVYLLELGAGSGRLAFYFLQSLLPMLSHSELRHLNVTYVLTDLPEQNVRFWKNHPGLAALMAEGRLDVARFDAMHEEEIHLQVSGRSLTPNTLANPLIVLANYFFDSIPQDAFSIHQGMLCEDLATLVSDQPGQDSPSAPASFDPRILPHLRIHFQPRFTSTEYFDDPQFNHVLQTCARWLYQGHLAFPTGGLEVIRKLRRLSGSRLLLIASDRGYFRAEDLRSQPEPRIFLHGSAFSMQVNFNVLEQYALECGGYALLSQHREEGLVTGAFVFGEEPAGTDGDALETRLAFEQCIVHGGPDDFFVLKKMLEPLLGQLTLDHMLALLRLSGYDSNVFDKCSPHLLEAVAAANEHDQQAVCAAAEQVWRKYFPIGEPDDLPLALAKIFLALGHYPQAFDCLQYSQREYGDSAEKQQMVERCQRYCWHIQ